MLLQTRHFAAGESSLLAEFKTILDQIVAKDPGISHAEVSALLLTSEPLNANQNQHRSLLTERTKRNVRFEFINPGKYHQSIILFSSNNTNNFPLDHVSFILFNFLVLPDFHWVETQLNTKYILHFTDNLQLLTGTSNQ